MNSVVAASVRNDVAAALSVSLGYTQMIERVAALAVPRIARFCFIDVVESGLLTRRAMAGTAFGSDTNAEKRAPHADRGEGAAAALTARDPIVYGPGWFKSLTRNDPALAVGIDAAISSLVFVPLLFDDRPLGLLTLGMTEDTDAVDRDLLSDFGLLAAMAMANAQLREASGAATERADGTSLRLSYISRASSIFARSFDRSAVLERFAVSSTIDFSSATAVFLRAPGMRSERYNAGEMLTSSSEELTKRAMSDGRSRLDDARRALATPLLTGGVVSGALTFSRSPEMPVFVIDDLTLVEDLAARTAMYVEASQTYQHQRRVAATLQEAFRPRDLPLIDGIVLAGAYQPGMIDMEVGGDWYDVLVMDDDRVAFAIGDVMGHGVQAAAVMAELRSGLRALLYANTDPGRCLAYVDTLLANNKESDMFATCAVAFLDRSRGLLTVANAGHPLPYIRRRNATVEAMGVSSTLLGLDVGPRTETVHSLNIGDMVVFYTDGVIEDRALPFDEGVAQLEAALVDTGDPATIIKTLLGISATPLDDRTLLAFALV